MRTQRDPLSPPLQGGSDGGTGPLALGRGRWSEADGERSDDSQSEGNEALDQPTGTWDKELQTTDTGYSPMNHDRLIQDILKCSTHHVGCGYLVRVDGKFHRPRTFLDMLALMARTTGGRIRYRCSGFADGTHYKMAAVITTQAST